MNQTEPRPRRSGSAVGGLIAVNAILLLILGVVTFAPSVEAQSDRLRSEYAIVGGRVNGIESSAIYIVDSVNRDLVVVTYDHNKNTLKGIATADLAADTARLTSADPRGTNR